MNYALNPNILCIFLFNNLDFYYDFFFVCLVALFFGFPWFLIFFFFFFLREPWSLICHILLHKMGRGRGTSQHSRCRH